LKRSEGQGGSRKNWRDGEVLLGQVERESEINWIANSLYDSLVLKWQGARHGLIGRTSFQYRHGTSLFFLS
jgi:hypothetical protein